MILAINKSKRVVHVNYIVSNTVLWQFAMAFVKEKGAEIVDSN